MERSPARMRTLAALAAAIAAFAGSGCGGGAGTHATSATSTTSAPTGEFVGIYSDDLFFGSDAYRAATLPAERVAGVQLVRQPFSWADFAKSPAKYDAFVGATARAGVHVLATVLGPEPGAPASDGMAPPKDLNAFAGFAESLVRRYGPDGSFWSDHPDIPKLPIRDWEIWNEPNIPAFWSTGPDPAAYTKLLEAASSAIHKADTKAQVVSAGLPTSEGGTPAPDFLEGIYRAGGKGAFDVLGAHPYAATPQKVEDHVMALANVMARNHDSVPMWVTEFGWATGGNPGPFTVTQARQASYLAQTMAWLGAHRDHLKLRGFVVFQWRDPKPFPGRSPIWPYYAGLLKDDGTPKPALAAFQKTAAQLER